MQRLLGDLWAFGYVNSVVTRASSVTCSASVSHPPANVTMETPGWVDFGHGVIDERLGVASIDAINSISVLNEQDASLRFFRGALGWTLH